MNGTLESRLKEIFDAVFIYSPEEYSIGGQRFPVIGASGTIPAPLVASLEGQLYSLCYSREFRLPLDLSPGTADPLDTLLIELSAANATRERWDHGWKVTQLLPNGSLYAQKEAQSRMLWPGEYMLLEPDVPAQPGAWIRAFLSKEDTRSQPGFYIVQPEIALSWEDYQTLVRFYWNLEAEGAAELLRLITERFNALRVPFQFKTLRYRSQYRRADSAVLFTGWRYAAIAMRLSAEVYRTVRNRMKSYTPLFAKRLAPGLALAEDPGNGQSFGMLRCRMLAECVWNAYQKRLQSHKARMTEFKASLEAAGVPLEAPYLSLSSVDHYCSEAEFAAL
ncbi:MAG: T3SS effector HopA1 family protein [Bryobacteraceae bacterium]